MKFFEELKRRNVFKETLAYLVASWVLLQVATVLLPIIDAPAWVLKTLTFFLALGLPVWIFFSWAYQVTPEGFKKTQKLGAEESAPVQSNKRLNILILVGLIAAIAVSFLNRSDLALGATNDELLEKSIAVLPFDDYSSGGDTEWFCDGVTEDIRTNLSKMNGITKVISHTSVEKFKNSEMTIPEIAKELGVSFIVEGNVRKYNNEIIITAKLIDSNDRQLWAENYNDDFDKVFEIQNNVAKQISKNLQITISPEEVQSINASKANNFESYEHYLRGRHLLNQNNPKAVQRSVEFLQKSIELDSTYAPAFVSLAEALIIINGSIRNHEEKLIHREKCYQAIDKALVLDPTLAEAYLTKGNMTGKFSWNWEEMIKMVEKGLKLEPNNSYGHLLLSKYYLIKNDYEKALEEVLIAEKLDPLNPGIGCFVADNYYLAQDFKKSLDQYEKVIKTFPDYPMAWEGVGHVLFESGNKKEAKASWGKFHDYVGNKDLAEVFSKESFDNSIKYWLEGVLSGRAVYCPHLTTVSYAFLFIDNEQKSLEYLKFAYQYRDQDLPIALISPHFYPLHGNSEFRDIVRKTGVVLPDINREFEIID